MLSVVISPFSFLISLIWFFSLFFLMSLANGLSIYLLKEPTFSFIDFCYSLVSFSFISALVLMISFLIPTLVFFISSFSSWFSVKLDYLFDFSLVSWGKLKQKFYEPNFLCLPKLRKALKTLSSEISFLWLAIAFYQDVCLVAHTLSPKLHLFWSPPFPLWSSPSGPHERLRLSLGL